MEDLKTRDGWYALYTRHQHEKLVHQALTGKGFEAFLPLYSAAHQWKDRVKRVSLPSFHAMCFFAAPSSGGSRSLPLPAFTAWWDSGESLQ